MTSAPPRQRRSTSGSSSISRLDSMRREPGNRASFPYGRWTSVGTGDRLPSQGHSQWPHPPRSANRISRYAGPRAAAVQRTLALNHNQCDASRPSPPRARSLIPRLWADGSRAGAASPPRVRLWSVSPHRDAHHGSRAAHSRPDVLCLDSTLRPLAAQRSAPSRRERG